MINLLSIASEVALKMAEVKSVSFSEINKLIMPDKLLEKSKEFGISNVILEQKPLFIDTLKEKLEVALEMCRNLEKVKGNISEELMDWYFKRSGWEKMEGEVGCNGIDGLYIKRDKNGDVKDVLVVESKYNTSRLGDTLNGKQMSKEWIEAKLSELEKANPDNKDYAQIKEHVQNGNYRARIWRMKEIDGNLYIEISKVSSDGNEVTIGDLQGNENYKINKIQKIDLDNPSCEYEKRVADAYNDIVESEINKEKEKINENKTNIAA